MSETIRQIRLVKPDLPPFAAVEGQFREILENGRITNFGKYVREFEQEVGERLGTHVATVSSDTAGLILALSALGLKPGERVVLPSFTFVATAQAVLFAGGIPVFAEIEDDFNLSAANLESLLRDEEDIGLVLPVHCFGLPCRVDEIQQVVATAARRRSRPISVLYDAAHGFGSQVGERKVGQFGSAEVFSLSVTKALVSVEGGLVASRDAQLIERVRHMRNYGLDDHYDAHWPGLNGKMSEFHAIVGLHNLRRFDALLSGRQRKARYYVEKLAKLTGWGTPPWPTGVTHTFKDFTVILPDDLAPRRSDLVELLRQRGIETRAYYYPPVHEQEYFRKYSDRSLPRTENLSRRVLTLPFYASISEDDMDYVVDALLDAQRALK